MRAVLSAAAPLLVAAALTFTACESDSSRSPTSARPSPGPSTNSRPPPADGYALRARIPTRPASLARALTDVHADLASDVERWLGDGGPLRGEVVQRIERAALYQQRIYRTMTRWPKLGRATLQHLDRPLQARAAANFDAGNGLSAGLVPLEPPVRLKTTRPESPHRLLVFYREAKRRFGIDWAILAAVNFVETRFGRILGPSSAGALGPMQFLPSTWERYGRGGDILDPHDSILGAARYLRASGAVRDPRSALFAYNRSDAYGDAVLTYARQIEQRPDAFYEYYFWQVFVRTTKGDMQLTGPGVS